jgi:putative ABC transport system ATP-binding protein
MLIDVRGLTHRIGDRTILSGRTFQVREGEHVLLLGPSGCGKTTLINILTGLVTPSAGEVTIAGHTITAMRGSARDAVRRDLIGLVFQTLRLVSALSVRENLLLAQHIAHGRSDRRQVEELVERVGLTHRINARPRELSHGESQRAAIARALCTRPPLVVADEPTSALDDANAQRMIDLLLSTAEATGATLLIATHDNRVRGRFARTIELSSQPVAA